MKSQSLGDPLARSLNERKQDSVRRGIFDQSAKALFEHGFHETTVDEIAKLAGIGRRTFFRYFDSKEDMVLWEFDQFARHALQLLEARPTREPSLLAMQRALTEASEFYNQEPAQTLAILQLTQATPSIFAQQLLQQNRWKGWFADRIRARTRASVRSLAPEMTAAIALEAMALAVGRWVANPGTNLSECIALAFAQLRKSVGPHPAEATRRR